MLQTIVCTTCNNKNNLSLSVVFEHKVVVCKNCHNTQDFKWTFFFCNLKCLVEWVEKVKNKGIPCQNCFGTGWIGGYKVNGICKSCDGKKFVKKMTMEGFAKIPKNLINEIYNS